MDNSPTEITPRAFNEIETAHYIGMSQAFLKRSRQEGKRENRTPAPPFIRVGNAIRYLKDDLDQWLDEQQRFDHIGQYKSER